VEREERFRPAREDPIKAWRQSASLETRRYSSALPQARGWCEKSQVEFFRAPYFNLSSRPTSMEDPRLIMGRLLTGSVATMVRGFAAILGAAMMVVISGCSVRQNFEAQPVPASIRAQPLNLSVAVLSDPALSFDYPPIYSLSDFREVMNPGLAETLRNGFGPAFQHVSLVENGREAAALDLLATPAIEVADPITLTVIFTEPKSGREVTRLSSSRVLDGHAFGTYSNLGIDLMLFATVVVVPPLDPVMAHQIRKHSAARFDAMFTPAIVQMVFDIAQQTSRDPRLASLSATRN
jgi:hypothetical protein